MKKLIVYFHGFGSSPNTDKVVRLKKEADFEVYAFPINIDYDVSIKELEHNIDMMLATDPEQPVKLVFVGTSLGGWWAKKMSKMYQCKAVVINPSVAPNESLKKYGVSDEICEKYHPIAPYEVDKYFFAEHDEVIDNVEFRQNLINAGYDVTIVKDANHRFNGESFELVVKYLKGL